MAGQMEILTREELEEAVLKRKPGERISFREQEFEPMDLTGWDLSNMDFTLSSFQNVILNQVNFSGSSVENALFDGCSLHGADFQDANMKTASFRYCDMGECNIKGANLFGAVLEYADLTEIQSDESTQWFRMRCPEKGAFLGYKKMLQRPAGTAADSCGRKADISDIAVLPVQQGKGSDHQKL